MVAWTDNDKYRLFLAIFDSMGETKLPSWDVVAGKLGPGFTAEAARQKYQKIKRDLKSELMADNTTKAGTPRKSRTKAIDGETTPPASSKKRSQNGKRKGLMAESMGDDEGGSPAKKQKQGSEEILDSIEEDDRAEE